MDNNKNKLATLPVIIAIIYVISPVDFIPDALPFIGQADDAVILVTAVLNLLQNVLPEFLGKLCKSLKWILIVLVAILIILFLKLFT